jgi:hypothetical protein
MATARVMAMSTELVLRPASIPLSVRCRRGARMMVHIAWRFVVAAAPACNLYWIVGMPPYHKR